MSKKALVDLSKIEREWLVFKSGLWANAGKPLTRKPQFNQTLKKIMSRIEESLSIKSNVGIEMTAHQRKSLREVVQRSLDSLQRVQKTLNNNPVEGSPTKEDEIRQTLADEAKKFLIALRNKLEEGR